MALQYTNENDTPVTLVTTNETVVATVANLCTQRRGQQIYIGFTGSVTVGTAGTAVVLRLRRGTTAAGIPVGNAVTVLAAAAAEPSVAAGWNDFPGDVAGQSYVVTAQQTAATGNGTFNQSATNAVIGNP
ncbi:MAG: hypothetical protein ACREQ5_01630 [Candidatus Dormibacteria bacterium]